MYDRPVGSGAETQSAVDSHPNLCLLPKLNAIKPFQASPLEMPPYHVTRQPLVRF